MSLMSGASLQALIFCGMIAVLVVVFVRGVRRQNSWRFAAPISIAFLAVVVWFNLQGYEFGAGWRVVEQGR